MALGTLGSTLNDELNRLANGGTYRDMNQMVDEALAAKQWANRENINPYSTDTVGILNEIAGLGLDKKNWLDFNGVCNYIAGTTGLPAAAALRQVYPTTDLLTSQSAYYIDATAPTNWGSLGYVRLNGVSGNSLSTPNTTALQITGSIDVRVQVGGIDWTVNASGNNPLITKDAGGSNRSWAFYRLSGAKTVRFLWSSNGTATTNATSTVDVPAGTSWIRATLNAANGNVEFFTSTNGTSWTQLGATVTGAGATSIFASTAQVEMGANFSVFGGEPLLFYRAQVLNGIGGTTVLDVNIASNFKASNEDTFTATTGQTVTVNGVDTIANLGAAGSLLPTTLGSSTAADSNDPKFLDFTGTNYVYLPGVTGNFLRTPDATALDITGDIDLRAYVALDDWTPSSQALIVSKWKSPNLSYALSVKTTGRLELWWSADGTNGNFVESTVAPTVADGQPLWIRATLDVDNGASGRDIKFFTSPDGTTWTQLGSTVTQAGTTSIFNSSIEAIFGANNDGGNQIAMKMFRVQIFAGLDGTDKRLDIDTSVITAGSATTFTAITGQTITFARATSGRKTVAVTQPTWLFGTDDYMEVNNRYMSSGTYLYLPGVASNYASTPDTNVLDVTGDLDIRVKVAMDDWTPASASVLLAKRTSSTTQVSYSLFLNTTGTLAFLWSTDGTTPITRTSTVATGIADGATKWVRATLDVDNGASGHDVVFYTSDDGITWTQLGTTITTAGTTSVYSGTAILEIGSTSGGSSSTSRGKFFRAQVLNGIDGTVAFDANFETSITSLLQTSFTESSANAATVTINRSGSAYRSAGITATGYLYPGATNTFSASATDFLNFGASDSFTMMAIHRQWDNAVSGALLGNRTVATGTVTPGYFMSNATNISGVNRTIAAISGSVNIVTTAIGDANVGWTSGVLNTHVATINRSTNLLSLTKNAGTAATADISTITTSSTNRDPFRIGAASPTAANYATMEFIAAAVFRSALTAAQVRQISNYFANREVYL